MTNFEFMQAAEVELTTVWNKLQSHSNVTHPRPKLTYNLRGGAAGEAAGAHTIDLNLGFVPRNPDEMLHQVVKHEAVHCWLTAIKDPSHYISYEQRSYNYAAYGRRVKRSPHGPTFMRYLAFLGGRTERTHSMDTSDVKRGWKYTCSCGNIFILSTRKHNIIRESKVTGRKTWCRKCKGELIYVGYSG